MPPTAYTEAEIRAKLAPHAFTYQNVALPYGISTGGRDRSGTAQAIFPPDLAGKSVLDLGCNYGYFCFEAERRGAARVVGTDIDPDNLAKCRLLADCLGSRAEFLRHDVERDPMPGGFDYVLCLNLLHHLRNPLAALDRLVEATRECLVLEVASLTPRDARKLGPAMALGAPLLRRLPAILLGGRGDAQQSFFLTESAVTTLLTVHRQGFARVDIVRGGQKGRFIALARKRRIGELYVVAGVNAVGKTTFLEALEAGRCPAAAERLGLDLGAGWSRDNYGKLARQTTAEVPRMLLQYNISKFLIDGDLHLHERGLLDVIRSADTVTVATLWLPASKLLERYRAERLRKRFRLAVRSRRRRRKEAKLVALFESPDRLETLYRDWFDFAERHAGANHVVLQDEGYRVVSVAAWRQAHPAPA
jgi:SAM-dependent methyltransferase